jgi:hypothetical protein
MDVRELGDWLNKHKSEIPERPKWKRTILDIMGCTTLENRWSDLYKFFFDENEEHGLRDLFIRSLEEVIGEKDGWMKDFCIFRENSTKEIREYEAGEDEMQSGSIDIEKKKEKGRIDLLIVGADRKAIIIENKVFATIIGNDNPLVQYVDTIKSKGYNDIKKVVLALQNNYRDMEYALNPLKKDMRYAKRNPKEYQYQYITHINLINVVLEKLPNYSTTANSSYLPLLCNFIQNIKNVTNMSATPEEIMFFNEQYESINEIYNLYRKVDRAYYDQLKQLNFDNINLSPDIKTNDDYDINRRMVYLQFGNTPLYLTLFLNSLWSKIASIPVIRVILEIRDKKLKVDVDKLNLNGAILSNDKDRVDYGHIAYFDIEIKDSKDLRPDKIVSIIKETINEDFPIYKLAKEIAKMCILNDA